MEELSQAKGTRTKERSKETKKSKRKAKLQVVASKGDAAPSGQQEEDMEVDEESVKPKKCPHTSSKRRALFTKNQPQQETDVSSASSGDADTNDESVGDGVPYISLNFVNFAALNK